MNPETALAPTPPPSVAMPRLALAHDFLVERGGAERVVIELVRAFPDAAIHTALCHTDRTYGVVAEMVAEPLLKDPFGLLGRHYRASLPLSARAFRRTEIDADVLIASSGGLAHLASTTGRHIVYCHTPARWLHRPDEYLRRFPAPARRVLGSALHRWLADADRDAMRSADLVLTNSAFTAAEIRSFYDIEPTVLRPVSSLEVSGPVTPIPGVEPGFFLTPSRLLGYKRLDVLLAAAARVPDHRFVVVGQGPLLRRLRRAAPPNVTVVGGVPEAMLRWAFQQCCSVVLTCADDYGLVPDEAAAFGKRAITPRAAGYLEEHAPGASTVAYRFGDPVGLGEAVAHVAHCDVPMGCYDLDDDRARFRREMCRVVASVMAGSTR